MLGASSPEAISHLLVRFKVDDGSAVFLASKYIARQVLRSCDASVYKVAYHLAEAHHPNPTFLGWVVELDFIAQMENSKGGKLEFVNENGKKNGIEWDIPDVINFDPQNSFDSSMLGTWLKPVKWNQEGYDLAGLFKFPGQEKLCLRFVQITNAVQHTVNMVHFM